MQVCVLTGMSEYLIIVLEPKKVHVRQLAHIWTYNAWYSFFYQGVGACKCMKD